MGRQVHRSVMAVLTGAALVAGAAAGPGCAGNKKWVAPTTPEQQTEEQVRRARELAIQAQRAERNGDIDEAIGLYRKAAAEYRDFAAVWNNLGRLLLETGDGLGAAQAYRVAADVDDLDPTPLYNLGLLWEERGYPEEAARYYAEALTRDESHQESLRRSILVDHMLLRGDETTAKRIRRALIAERDPKWREFLEREKIRVQANLNEQEPGVIRDRS